jgi:hypothetical protein
LAKEAPLEASHELLPTIADPSGCLDRVFEYIVGSLELSALPECQGQIHQ